MTQEAKTQEQNQEKTQTAVEADSEFSEAFQQATSPAGGATGGDDGKGGGDDTTAAAADKTAGDATTGKDDKTAGKDGESAASGAADDSKTTTTTDSPEVANLRKELDDLKQKHSSWDGRLKASDREKNAFKAERDELAKKFADLEAKTKAGGATGDDVDVDEELKKLKAEYPDLVGPLWGAFERMLKKQQQEFDTKVETRVAEKLKPTEKRIDDVQMERHVKAIEEKHLDFRQVAASKELETWIDSKPKYVQREAVRVLGEGTATEVIDLLDDYKRDRDAAKAAADATAEAARQKQDKDKRKNQAADAGAVKGRSGGVTTGGSTDPNDFGGAFEEATRGGSGKR